MQSKGTVSVNEGATLLLWFGSGTDLEMAEPDRVLIYQTCQSLHAEVGSLAVERSNVHYLLYAQSQLLVSLFILLHTASHHRLLRASLLSLRGRFCLNVTIKAHHS